MGETESEDSVGLLVLEAKSLRPFKTKDEYLYAMKEDLAEWFTCLYKEISLDADNFFDVLDTGVLLCQHANEVRKFASEQKSKGTFDLKSNFVRAIQIPEYDVQFRLDVKPGTFLARDNISNFITWTSKMGIPEVLRFETDDLVLRKNERSVVLCLLELARVGAKFGMLAPTIVQMEEEIDNEIETGEPPPQIKTCDIKSLDEMVRELVGRCTCPRQFPIIKVGEGKYKIGDNQTLVFVRILRKHVMIRVGGGWDTLEHYLDRHDPCRCGFTGHRGGRGPSTPRRASTAQVPSKSLPTTPKTPRKLSLAAQGTLNNSHSGNNARPASPQFKRSASPGPNSRKLSLTAKTSNGSSVSQPGSSVTSPVISNKPNFSKNGLNSSGKLQQQNISQQNGPISSSGGFPVGNFVKQSQINLTRQLSSGSGGQPTASLAARASSPALRRSESPVPVTNRLRSPSPVPSSPAGSNLGPARTQSVPATQRCVSPMKQITMSELRSSRDGKLTNQQAQTGTQKVKRQASGDSTKSRDSESEMTSDSSNFTIDKISTMSLGEFKNLLNSALSAPNGTSESQCSSDSPRSQSSVESSRNNGFTKTKSTPIKSAYSYRSQSATRPSSTRSTTKPSIPTKPSFDSSSGYSGSPASDKTRSNFSSPGSTKSGSTTPRTLTNGNNSRLSSRTPSSTSVKSVSSVTSSGYGQDNRPKTPSTLVKSKSNTSSVSDTAYQYQTNNVSKTATSASRSGSHSSLQSYESVDDRGLGADLVNNAHAKPAFSPSSVDSDYSFRGSSGTNSDYARSNSYTPCSSTEDKLRLRSGDIRASSEPRDIQPNHVTDATPFNVGYASFSFDDSNISKDNDMDEIENEIVNSRQDSIESSSTRGDSSELTKQSNMRPQTPSGRATPSFIPRPITPKISRKLSLPQNENTDSVISRDEKTARTGRPPTPKKSSIMARAHSAGVRSADKSKEQTYREIFQKRSTTPGPGSSQSNANTNVAAARRSMTPGPYLNKTSALRMSSATTNRALLNEAKELMDQKKDVPLSVYTGKGEKTNISNGIKRAASADSKTLTKQKSLEQGETVIVVNVDRSDNKHSISVAGENEKRSPNTINTMSRAKVLARARTEDNRARAQSRQLPGNPRQRPQSVEPRQLIPRGNKELSVKNSEEVPAKFDRTQQWVQNAVEQTKVKKTKPTPRTSYTPQMRRAMTPNSFDMRIDTDKEEPKTLEEIKAALSLPLTGLDKIEVNTEELEAPPEDAQTYAEMEALFQQLRQQELKNSVNETPGTATPGTKAFKSKSKSSRSNSSINDDELSLDSNKNVKRTAISNSTKSSVVMSPQMSRANNSSRSQSRASSASSNGGSNVTTPLRKSSVTSRGSVNSARTPLTTRPGSPSLAGSVRRASSPRVTSQPPRPASPRVTSQPPRPASPRVTSQPPRPASPRVTSHSQRPASPRVTPHTSRPPSPRTSASTVSSAASTPSKRQPPRPASTPPRPSTPVKRQGSRSSDDNDGVFLENDKKGENGLLSKIKEIINVKPRKDKLDGVKAKSRIPAPKSLASVGKSRSFSNLSNLSGSLTLSPTDTSAIHSFDEPELNGYADHDAINGGLNVTLSGRSETPGPGPKWAMPLITGRSSLIRKESMEKNKTSTNRLTRAVSVERNMTGVANDTYTCAYDDEYV